MEELTAYYKALKDTGYYTIKSYEKLDKLDFNYKQKNIIKKLIKETEYQTLSIIEPFIEEFVKTKNTIYKMEEEKTLKSKTPLEMLLEEIEYFEKEIDNINNFTKIAINTVYKYFDNPTEIFINTIATYSTTLRNYNESTKDLKEIYNNKYEE